MIKNNDEARELIAKKRINKDNVTNSELKALWVCVNNRMVESGNYRGTYRMDSDNISLFMTCSTYQWKGREAVSFNRDGFIGFAGWADSNNIRPILDGVEDWLKLIPNANRERE